jgi:hypothetical protein
MGLFSSKKTAEKLDTAAATLHHAGTRIGGETGGRIGDAVANATLGPIRKRAPHACTRPDCTHD